MRNLDAFEKSFGKKLLLDWIEEDTLKIINDPAIHTRIDPANNKGSTLDLCIVSKDIEKNIVSFDVDINKDLTPFSIHKNHNQFTKKYTDHLSLNLKIKLPSIKQRKQRKIPVINMSNPEGWLKYKEVTDRYADIIENKVKNVENINLLEADLHVLELDILLECFGVTFKGPGRKLKAKKSTKELKDMLEEDIIEMDELLSKGYNSKDLNQKIYKLKRAIIGPKLTAQETMAINDPETGELITDNEKIKEVSLQHNIKILTKNKPREKDKEEIKLKKENHERIMNKNNKDSWELDREMYKKSTQMIKEKGKKMFDLFNKAGDKYKNAIFYYMKRIIESEEVPHAFNKTKLTQIWKKKGSALDLNNMRFIHGREWRPRLCEKLVTDNMKPDIIEACPQIQIGGIPGNSSVQHLYTLKIWMKIKEERKENGIFQTFDMSKFFDKESLLDTMYTLSKEANINDKTYRLWHKLNENTRISVITSVGETKSENITDSIGQGSFGAALASTLNIGCAVDKLFKDCPSTSIGELKINSLVLQDDISKINDKLDQAREGCEKLDEMLKSKQLSVNYDKSKYIVLGTTKFRQSVLKDTKENPMKMGGMIIESSNKEKYLGDYIHEDGCAASISETIKRRIAGLINRCEEIVRISESPIMGGIGKSTTAFNLFEIEIIPSLLHNCESWIGIKESHIKDLQDFQNKFIRKVLRLPHSTPKAILEWDTGLCHMKWRIISKKIIFLKKIQAKDDDNIAKQTLIQEEKLDMKGLLYECRQACEEMDLPALLENDVDRKQLKVLIREKCKEECRVRMLESKKVNDRISDDPEEQSYLEYMSLPESRIWMRLRARSITGVKANNKKSYEGDLSCRYCKEGILESQEQGLQGDRV